MPKTAGVFFVSCFRRPPHGDATRPENEKSGFYFDIACFGFRL